MATQKKRPDDGHHHDAIPDFEKHHDQMTRFPSDKELRAMDTMWGIDRSLDPTEYAL